MKDYNLKKMVILCGGTGGHFYPGLTIARKLQEQGGKAYLFIGGHLDKIRLQSETAGKYGIEVFVVNSSKLSKNPFKLIKFVYNLFFNYLKARSLLKQLKPEAVLGMGSFTSLPAGFATIFLKIPFFLHDGNAVIGKANLFFSKWAKVTMTAFPAVNKDKLKNECIYSGMPIRPEFLSKITTKDIAITEINDLYKVNFTTDSKIIFVFGGSQGAETINNVIPDAIRDIKNQDIQIIHLFGKVKTSNPYKYIVKNSLILKSCDKMHLLYSVADLIISRAGGSTIAELLNFNKPAVLIPYPHKDLQQKYNAEFYQKSSNSEILMNENCNSETVKGLIEKLLLSKVKKTAEKNECIFRASEKILETISENI